MSQKIVSREELDRISVEYIVSIVKAEMIYTFENNDNNPTTFDDYLSDAITALEMVRDGDRDDNIVHWIEKFQGTVADIRSLATFEK